MLPYIEQSPVLSLSTLIISFVLFRFFSRHTMVSELDPMGIANIGAAFSLSTLIALYKSTDTNIPLEDVVKIILLFLVFYFGIYIIRHPRAHHVIKRGVINKLFVRGNIHSVTLFIFWLVSFALSLTFTLLIFTSGSSFRLGIAKQFRVLDIITMGAGLIFTYYAMGFYLAKKNKQTLILILVAVLMGFLSTSKGFLLNILIAYFTMNGLLHGRRSFLSDMRKWYLVVLGLLGGILTTIFWQGHSFTDGILAIVNRLFASGDIYYYALVAGDYQDLFGHYHFWSYLFHPFTSLVGIRGYEWPLGSELRAFVTGAPDPYGPNPHLALLVQILLHGNMPVSIVFCLAMGMFVSWSRLSALHIMQIKKIPVLWKFSVFVLFFCSAPTILFDIGLFEIQLIAVTVVTTCMTIFQAMTVVRHPQPKALKECG